MPLQYEWHYTMNDTTVLIISVNTGNCLQEITSLFLVSQATAFNFHDNHGTGIVLSDDKQTAERTADILDEIVTSPDPMMENTVHEVNNSQ